MKWLGLALSPLLALPLLLLIWPEPIERAAKWLISRIDAISGWALGGAIASAIILVGSQLLVVLLRYAFGLSFTLAERDCRLCLCGHVHAGLCLSPERRRTCAR